MTNKKKLQIRNSTAEFLIFTKQAKEDGIEVRVQNDTIWLSQKLMGALFDCSTDNISLHLKNIFKENELDENSVTEEFSVTASDGKTYMRYMVKLLPNLSCQGQMLQKSIWV